MLTKEEIMLILDLITEKYGRGYCKIIEVEKLQVKLSIMLEAKRRMEKQEKGAAPA